jgi:hypothetical protein
MANEFKVKNGLIVVGDLTTSGTITINGALAATQSWVTSQGYLTSASLSGYATQSYVTSAIAALVDSAPAALDTLNELAAALGDDANFSTTITTAIGNKVSKSGDTMTGDLTLNYGYPRINFYDSNHDSDYALINNDGSFSLYDITNNVHRWWVTPGGNVGIGTTGPACKLHVDSTNQQFRISGNTNHFNVYSWADGVNVWSSENLYFGRDAATANKIFFQNGSASITTMYINTAVGTVGIGTTSPSFKTTISADITKSGDINPGTAQLSLEGSTTPGKRMILGYDTNSNGFGFIKAGNYGVTWTALSLQPDGGNVGIGTTSPASKLQVTGDIRIQNETGLITDYGPLVGRYNTSQVYVGTGGSYSVVKIGRADGGALNVLSGGNVGIGTDSPNYKLHVAGNSKVDGQTLMTSGFSTYTTDGLFSADALWSGVITPSGAYRVRFGYLDQGGGQYWGRIGFVANTNWSLGTAQGGTSFSIGMGNGNSEFLINNAGKVSIGTSDTNSDKSDFTVYTGSGASLALTDDQVRMGGGDVNWGVALRSYGALQTYGQALTLNTQAGNYAVNVQPNGTTVAQFYQDYSYFPGLDFSISRVNAPHASNYFRGDASHLVIGTSGTLYLNYGGNTTVITGNTTVSGGLGVSGIASAGARKLSMGILDLNSGITPAQYKIKTSIPWNYGGSDFTVNIKGFRYGTGQMVSLSIGWHYYNNEFYNRTAISNGAWAPTISLAKSSDGYVIIYIPGPDYWPKLYIESVYSSNSTDSYTSGWSWSDANLSDCTLIQTVPYGALATNISGNSATTSQTNFSSLTINSAAVATQAWVGSQGYLTSVSDVWVNTTGDTMTGSLAFADNADDVRLYKGSNWLNLRDNWNNIHLRNNISGYGIYTDATIHYWRPHDGSNNYMTLSSTGLGIGTSSPETKLHVAGGKITLKGGSSTDQQIVFNYAREYVNGIYNSSGHFRLQDNSLGGTVYQWDGSTFAFPNGNIGIGTSSPAQKLSVAGNIETVNGTGVKIGFNVADSFTAYGNSVAHYGISYNYGASPVILSGYFGVGLFTNGIERFSINNAGNVGIGIASPTALLHVANSGRMLGVLRIQGTNRTSFYDDTFAVNNDGGGADGFIYGSNVGGSFPFDGYGEVIIQANPRTGYSNGISLVTGTTSPTIKLRVTEAGNVGIGTSTPQVKLDVNGALGIVGSNFIYFGHTTGNIGAWTTRQYSNGSTHTFNAQTFIFNNEGYGSYQHMALTANGVNLRGKNTIDSTDSWLRLNQSGDYGSGVYTPGVMRADGGFQVSGSTVWHAGNDGSGSGLDADLLDGVDSGSFLRSDVSDSFSGTLTMATQRALVPSNYGHGVYGIYSAERYQHVWSMGAGYDLPADGASNGNGGSLYGLAWSYNPDYSYVGSNAQAKPGLNHQLLLMMNGITYTALGNGIWTSGTITTVSHGTSSQWNTAYGWGNHASAGYATTSYVTTQINNLIAGAPGALDTLDELAAALGDDSNFATTVTNSIATKLPLAGGTMTGDINWTQTNRGLTWGMNTDGAYIKFYNTGDGDVNSRLEYATSDNGDEYHRWLIAGTEKMTLKWAGLTINGTITATGYNNTNWDTAYGWGNHASAGYAAASSLANYLPLAGGTMSGSINMNGNNVINIGQVNATHAIFTNDGSSRVMYLRGSGNIIQFQNAAATDKWEIVGRDGEFYVYKSDGAGSGYKWRIDGVGNHTITGNLTVTGTITESSSLKLKENVETSEGNLEKVVNLRPVTYNKIGSQTTELGLIAEEVAEVYPEFVQYDENGDPIGVNYSRLTAALIGAVKELTNQVQELNKKING